MVSMRQRVGLPVDCLFVVTAAVLSLHVEARAEPTSRAPAAEPDSTKVEAVAATAKGALTPESARNYVIGVEDVLFISVWKNPDISKEVPVRPDGKITLPLIDDVSAAGLTPAQLKEVLTQRWKSYITAPEVSVIVTQVNSLKVYMVGEVQKPGILVLKGDTRLLQALSQVGGFTPFADRSKIVVLRKNGSGESRLEFSYKRIVSGDRPEDNIFLLPGDTVIVQ